MLFRSFTKLRVPSTVFTRSTLPCQARSHRPWSREINTSSACHYKETHYLSTQDIPYSEAHTTTQPENIQAIYQRTMKGFSNSYMMISPLQGSFLTFLVQMHKAKRVLEIGTFTGYSAACMAEGLKLRGDGAKVVTLEKDELYQKMAKENIEAAGYSDLIEFVLGDASELIELMDNSVPYDLVFLDAKKDAYVKYYNTVLERNLLSDDGIIVADNVLFRGCVSKVPDFSLIPPDIRDIVKSLHKFNEHVAKDPRTTQVLLPLFDGLTMIRKIT